MMNGYTAIVDAKKEMSFVSGFMSIQLSGECDTPLVGEFGSRSDRMLTKNHTEKVVAYVVTKVNHLRTSDNRLVTKSLTIMTVPKGFILSMSCPNHVGKS